MRKSIDTVEEFWTWERVQQAREIVTTATIDEFRADFADLIGVGAERLFLMPSGRQALEWLLKARRDSRRVVMMPAFNCSVVQGAVKAAGFQPQLYDFSPQPGLFNWQRVIEEMDSDVGVLIVTHYFGVPVDFRFIRDHCAMHGIAIIEDCAHTLGGAIAGCPAGALGDAAIFSFNYDKPISLGWGGLAVINQDALFDGQQPTEHRIPDIGAEMRLLRRFVDVMEVRRRMIPHQHSYILRALRKLNFINSTNFSKPNDTSMGFVQAALGRWCLRQYSGVIAARRFHAEMLADSIRFPSWPVGEAVTPAWIKQKIRVGDVNVIKKLSLNLEKNGIRAGNFNWPVMIDGKNGENCAQAQDASMSWMDIPIHQRMNNYSLALLIDYINSAG